MPGIPAIPGVAGFFVGFWAGANAGVAAKRLNPGKNSRHVERHASVRTELLIFCSCDLV
jgi:hypothetical protein